MTSVPVTETPLHPPGGRPITLLLVGTVCLLALLLGIWQWDWPVVFQLLFALLVSAAIVFFVYQLHRLWATQRAYQMAMQAAHDGFWEWNPVSKRLNVGTRLLEILGYDRNFLPDTHTWLELVHPDDREHYNHTVAAHLKGQTGHFYCEYRVRARSGEYRWIASRGIAVRNRKGVAYQMAGSVTDITDRRRHEDEIDFLARHDQLTGLPNRFLLAERLEAALNQAKAGDHRVAVLFIDLDRFKDINDALGHRLGDGLLQSVAHRLQSLISPAQTLIRQGGDEFIIIIPGPTDAASAQALGERLLGALEAPFSQEGYLLHVGASIGFSLYPDDAENAEALLRNADTAMYAAKKAGGGAVWQHTVAMKERVRHRVSMEARLRLALERQQFTLHYQPQIDLRSGRLVGAEALLRWREGEAWIGPDRFIPVAEEIGLIVPIGDWVLATAIRDLAAWRRVHPHLRMAINLSPRQFLQKGLGRRILDLIAEARLPPSAVELEITESMLMEPDSGSIATLRELREAGVKLALDDFGTGYSSLSYLQRLPFTSLKIDRAFVRALLTPAAAAGDGEPLVRAIIAMAHSLGLAVTAEGVEFPGQLALLRGLGCDHYQGFLCSPALPADEFTAFTARLGVDGNLLAPGRMNPTLPTE